MDEDRAAEQAADYDDGPESRLIADDWNGGAMSMPQEAESDGTISEDGDDVIRDDEDDGALPAGTPEKQERGADQSFRLKYLGQEIDVSRDEIITLAQKGKDYDRIRSRADALSNTVRENSGYLEFLGDLAKKSGQSLNEFVGRTSAAMDMPASGITEGSGAGIRRSEAQGAKERRDREVAEFISEYKSIDPRTIPGEVWDGVKAGKSLLSAYQGYENRLLKARIDAEKKNLENRLKTAGSRATSGPARPRGEIEDDWYNND